MNNVEFEIETKTKTKYDADIDDPSEDSEDMFAGMT